MKSYLLRKGFEFKESEGDFQLVECPQCGDRRSKFGISKEKDYISHCWICDSSFTLCQFIMLVEGISQSKAFKFIKKKKLKRTSSLDHLKKIDLIENKKPKRFNYDDPSIEMEFPKDFEKLNDHILYTKQRGLGLDTIKKFNLHICYYGGKWGDRLIVPVYHCGKLVGWQGRDITGKAEKKIKSCKGFKKSKFIINYDEIKNKKAAVLCEGPFDVMSVSRAVKKIGVFGIMGKSLSTAQLNLLLKTKLTTIYIGLDPDYPENREKAAEKLRQFFDVRMVPIPDGSDLGDLDKKRVLACLCQSEEVSGRYLRLD